MKKVLYDPKILYLECRNTLKKFDPWMREEVVFSKLIKGCRRKFRADFYCPHSMLIVEINGGEWIQGRHTRAVGYQNDLEKCNLAQLHGYYYLQYTYEQLAKNHLSRDLKLIRSQSEPYDEEN